MVILDRLHLFSFEASEHIKNNARIYCFAISIITLSAIICGAYHDQNSTQGESRARSGQMIAAAISNASSPIRQLHKYIHNNIQPDINIWDVN